MRPIGNIPRLCTSASHWPHCVASAATTERASPYNLCREPVTPGHGFAATHESGYSAGQTIHMGHNLLNRIIQPFETDAISRADRRAPSAIRSSACLGAGCRSFGITLEPGRSLTMRIRSPFQRMLVLARRRQALHAAGTRGPSSKSSPPRRVTKLPTSYLAPSWLTV